MYCIVGYITSRAVTCLHKKYENHCHVCLSLHMISTYSSCLTISHTRVFAMILKVQKKFYHQLINTNQKNYSRLKKNVSQCPWTFFGMQLHIKWKSGKLLWWVLLSLNLSLCFEVPTLISHHTLDMNCCCHPGTGWKVFEMPSSSRVS